jgi:hypothetical protein
LWAPVALRILKGGEGLGVRDDRDQRIQYPLPHLVLSPIAKAQQRRDSSTPHRLTGFHRIRCCSCFFDSTLADLLPLHRRVPLRRLHRCRVHRTSPPVRHTNPRSLRLSMCYSRIRPTRHCPNRSLSTTLRPIPNKFRMEKEIFYKLVEVLRDGNLLANSREISVEEQLAMFLFCLSTNASNRTIQERFQHSGETVSRYLNIVLEAIVSLSPRFIQLPSIDTPIQISSNPKFMPYFKLTTAMTLLFYFLMYCC